MATAPTTSGTYNFFLSRDDLIGAALRATTRFSAGEPIPSADLTDCAQALNIVCKSLAKAGFPLWCVQEYTIPMIQGQAQYNLSTLLGMPRPQAILDAFLRDTTSNTDVGITLESRYDYNTLGSKTTQGRVNQVYYNPQLSGATLTVYNVPADNNTELHITVQRQIQDINLATENPDFPQEAYRMLKWVLADEIALDYSTPKDVRAEIAAKARYFQDNFFDGEQDTASVMFTPSTRTR